MKKITEFAIYLLLTISFASFYIGWTNVYRGIPAYIGLYLGMNFFQIIGALTISFIYYLIKRKKWFRVFMNVLWVLTIISWFILCNFNY